MDCQIRQSGLSHTGRRLRAWQTLRFVGQVRAGSMLWLVSRPVAKKPRVLGSHPIGEPWLRPSTPFEGQKPATGKRPKPGMEKNNELQRGTVTKLRTLSHDLSNSIETIMQASYLLAQVKLADDNRKWIELIDKAAQEAAHINREIREILRTQG